MRRRVFVSALCGAVVLPFFVRANQATSLVKIGLLSPFSPSDTMMWHQAFRARLQELGWTEGNNLAIEYRYANGNNDQLLELITDLIRLKIDVIVTSVTNDTLATKNATATIPIVMAAAGDPVATGIVQSLARPGGNITGLSQMNTDLSGKRLELLREVSPQISSVAVLSNPDDPISALGLKEFQQSASRLGLAIFSFEIRDTRELDKAFDHIARAHSSAIAIMPNPVFVISLKRIADFAQHERLPSVFHLAEFPEAGGLLSYGVDRTDLFRRAAGYVDKILRGARPGDLPIEQPTKFEFVINLRTAKALGLTIPQMLLARADQVIE